MKICWEWIESKLHQQRYWQKWKNNDQLSFFNQSHPNSIDTDQIRYLRILFTFRFSKSLNKDICSKIRVNVYKLEKLSQTPLVAEFD